MTCYQSCFAETTDFKRLSPLWFGVETGLFRQFFKTFCLPISFKITNALTNSLFDKPSRMFFEG